MFKNLHQWISMDHGYWQYLSSDYNYMWNQCWSFLTQVFDPKTKERQWIQFGTLECLIKSRIQLEDQCSHKRNIDWNYCDNFIVCSQHLDRQRFQGWWCHWRHVQVNHVQWMFSQIIDPNIAITSSFLFITRVYPTVDYKPLLKNNHENIQMVFKK